MVKQCCLLLLFLFPSIPQKTTTDGCTHITLTHHTLQAIKSLINEEFGDGIMSAIGEKEEKEELSGTGKGAAGHM